jgi:hypothetical protein
LPSTVVLYRFYRCGGRLFEVSGKKTVEKIYAQIERGIFAINTAWDTRRIGAIRAKVFIKSASRPNRRI